MAKKRRSTKACRRATISFETKRGKEITFAGRTGADCGPRPKPKTGHLNPYKKEFARQAKACKGRSRGAFLKCMARAGGALPAR